MNFQLKSQFPRGWTNFFLEQNSWIPSEWAECLNNCFFSFIFSEDENRTNLLSMQKGLFFFCGQFLIVRFLLSVCFFKTAQTNQSTVQTYICNSGMKLSSSILNGIYIVMGNHGGGVCVCVCLLIIFCAKSIVSNRCVLRRIIFIFIFCPLIEK